MSNSNLHDNIKTLEERLMHLEAALDEVTQTLLKQETQLKLQADTIRRLESLLKGLADSGMGDAQREPPPPHY
jgi:uncharacterized coiled-coil protein SlyX